MNKKYEFTGKTKVEFGVTLKQIRALVAIGFSVSAGDVGGWIEKEENLDVSGNAWVSGDARVFGNARVSGDAQVSGDARVYGNARVSGDAQVHDHARVSVDAQVHGNALVSGDAQVSGDARVYGNAWVCGDAWVSGDARVHGNAAIVWISKVGSEFGTLTAYKNKDGGITVTRGCFVGSLDEFKTAVSRKHSGTKHEYAYLGLANYIEYHLNELHK